MGLIALQASFLRRFTMLGKGAGHPTELGERLGADDVPYVCSTGRKIGLIRIGRR
jgi:hypothetical protein